jgi:hypothetical protein
LSDTSIFLPAAVLNPVINFRGDGYLLDFSSELFYAINYSSKISAVIPNPPKSNQNEYCGNNFTFLILHERYQASPSTTDISSAVGLFSGSSLVAAKKRQSCNW